MNAEHFVKSPDTMLQTEIAHAWAGGMHSVRANDSMIAVHLLPVAAEKTDAGTRQARAEQAGTDAVAGQARAGAGARRTGARQARAGADAGQAGTDAGEARAVAVQAQAGADAGQARAGAGNAAAEARLGRREGMAEVARRYPFYFISVPLPLSLFPPILSSHHCIPSLHVIISCHHHMQSSNAIITCHHHMPSSHAIIACHDMISPSADAPGVPPTLHDLAGMAMMKTKPRTTIPMW